jgi:hypothetical protein
MAVGGRPFRASDDRQKTQGKPWAKLSWPFGPEEPRRISNNCELLGSPAMELRPTQALSY